MLVKGATGVAMSYLQLAGTLKPALRGSLTHLHLEKMASHFADDIFKRIFLKFVLKGSTDIKWALVRIMAWRQTDDESLPEKNAVPVHWQTYAALGGDELSRSPGDSIGWNL